MTGGEGGEGSVRRRRGEALLVQRRSRRASRLLHSPATATNILSKTSEKRQSREMDESDQEPGKQGVNKRT